MHCRLRSHMEQIGIEKSALCHSPCPAVMHSPQKRKHLANRKFPRKQTPWNSHRPTPDGAFHRPDGTTNITSLHRTLKKKICKEAYSAPREWWHVTRKDIDCLLYKASKQTNKSLFNQTMDCNYNQHIATISPSGKLYSGVPSPIHLLLGR